MHFEKSPTLVPEGKREESFSFIRCREKKPERTSHAPCAFFNKAKRIRGEKAAKGGKTHGEEIPADKGKRGGGSPD